MVTELYIDQTHGRRHHGLDNETNRGGDKGQFFHTIQEIKFEWKGRLLTYLKLFERDELGWDISTDRVTG